MQVGEAWWQQIVAALTNEHVEYMVLVLTPAAMRSDMVRKEWRLARQEGVCVLPVIAAPDLDFQSLPHWMGAVHPHPRKSMSRKACAVYGGGSARGLCAAFLRI
jgi:alpha-ketoglutarate-dependent taurine dioxygenase